MCCATLPLLQLTAGKQVLQCNTCGPLSICVFAWINKHRTEIRHGAANAHAPYCLHARYSFLLIGRCQIVFKRIFSPNIASGLHPNLAACVHYLWSTISERLNLTLPYVLTTRRPGPWWECATESWNVYTEWCNGAYAKRSHQLHRWDVWGCKFGAFGWFLSKCFCGTVVFLFLCLDHTHPCDCSHKAENSTRFGGWQQALKSYSRGSRFAASTDTGNYCPCWCLL